MNIISYNVRGLGRGVIWPAIRRMVIEQHIDMLCLQETKKEMVEKSMCAALWGGSEIGRCEVKGVVHSYGKVEGIGVDSRSKWWVLAY